jgi:hypothetical protein
MFENPAVNLNALCNVCANIMCFSSELIFMFVYEGRSIQNVGE